MNHHQILKLHLHTQHPPHVFNYAQHYPQFIKLKLQNITDQHTQ
ncbi:hypothetical protein, partial [Staphylococcus capitis]